MSNQRVYETSYRQHGRSLKNQSLAQEAGRARERDRQKLRDRVQTSAAKSRQMMDAIQLEKDLEMRRCQLCDMVRAEAWGLGHSNWWNRKCAACWRKEADTEASARHRVNEHFEFPSLSPGMPTMPTMQGKGQPPQQQHRQGGDKDYDLEAVVAALRARDADALVELLDARALERHFGVRQLEDPDAFIAQGGPAAARALYYHEAVLGRIDPDLLEQGVVSFIDDVPPSLRAAQQEQPQMKATSATDSDDEEDDEDNEEEDDDVRSDTTAAMRMKLQKRRERKAGALSDDSGAESNDDAAGSRAGSDMQPAAGAASRSNHKPPARRAVGDDEDAEIAVKPRAKLKVPKAPESDDYEDDEDEDENDHSKGRGVSSSAPHDASPASAAEAAAAAAAAAIAAQQAQQQPRDAERHGLDSELSFSSAAARVTGAGRPSTPGRTGRQSQPSFFDQALAQWTETVKSDAANATAQNKAHEEDPRLQQQEVLSPGQASPLPSGPDGRRRPLPSQQKCLPTSTEGMEAALKQAELTLVWAPSQAERSAALFYADQLRSALADIRRADRIALRAHSAERRASRLDPSKTTDAYGCRKIAHIIKEGRRGPRDKPTPAQLERYADPNFEPYIDPPRRPEHRNTTHPAKPDPVKVADIVMPWRPASAKVVLPHPPGWQSVGDFDDKPWRREAEMMRKQSLDNYKSWKRNEREWRRLVAQAQAQQGAKIAGVKGSAIVGSVQGAVVEEQE